MGMDKATIYIINEPPKNHGQQLIEKLPLHLLLENQEICLDNVKKFFVISKMFPVWPKSKQLCFAANNFGMPVSCKRCLNDSYSEYSNLFPSSSTFYLESSQHF
jgi:hypothetical protein